MAVRVVLTSHEMLHAGLVGLTRQIDNLWERRTDRYGAQPRDGWRMHIEGALGEMALAKHMDCYWSGRLGELKAPDVGPLQVRTRVRQENAGLILHPDDRDDQLFVLVISWAPVFMLIGWTLAADGKQERYWKDIPDNRSAFFVPHSALQPIESLHAALEVAA